MPGKNKRRKAYMVTTWQTVPPLEVQLHVTLLDLSSVMVTLKPSLHEVWPMFQCLLFSFEDIVLRVCTVTE